MPVSATEGTSSVASGSSSPPTTSSPEEDRQLTRNTLGQFVRGVSGNPAGRERGSKNRATLIRHAMEESLLRGVSEDFEAIMAEAISLAKSGNEAMIRLLLGDLLKGARGGDGDENDPLRNAKSVHVSITQYLGNQEKPAAATVDGEFETVEDSHDPASRP